jgi:hypothetical protein
VESQIPIQSGTPACQQAFVSEITAIPDAKICQLQLTLNVEEFMKSSWRFQVLGLFFLACMVAVARPASAQRWEIVRAEYGAPGRMADVTNIVRDLANSNQPRLQVGNNTMGGDPALGRTKVLRIFARMPNGMQRDFTFREYEYVDFNYFRAGGGFRPMPGPPIWGRARRPDAGACFYRDPNFSGDYFCMNSGMSYDSLPPGFNDRITSIRIFGPAEVTIFNDSGFRGVNGSSRDSVQDLRYWRLPTDPNRSWNDRVSSIQVR